VRDFAQGDKLKGERKNLMVESIPQQELIISASLVVCAVSGGISQPGLIPMDGA